MLLGCGALLLLLIGLVLFMVKVPTVMRWWFEKLEVTLAPRLPDDATPEERRRLHAAFAAAPATLIAGRADPARLQQFQRRLMEVATSEKKLTRDQMRELTRALEQLASPSSPAPAPGPPPHPGGLRARPAPT